MALTPEGTGEKKENLKRDQNNCGKAQGKRLKVFD